VRRACLLSEGLSIPTLRLICSGVLCAPVGLVEVAERFAAEEVNGECLLSLGRDGNLLDALGDLTMTVGKQFALRKAVASLGGRLVYDEDAARRSSDVGDAEPSSQPAVHKAVSRFLSRSFHSVAERPRSGAAYDTRGSSEWHRANVILHQDASGRTSQPLLNAGVAGSLAIDRAIENEKGNLERGAGAAAIQSKRGVWCCLYRGRGRHHSDRERISLAPSGARKQTTAL
jgi:hypothetical protein